MNENDKQNVDIKENDLKQTTNEVHIFQTALIY